MAQQVEKINPQWVNNSASFGKAADGTNLKSVYEQQMQYGVNIVVQEAMQRIESLEAEIKLLKTK
jgi:predicted xylose isomerase-like sugar epimerase